MPALKPMCGALALLAALATNHALAAPPGPLVTPLMTKALPETPGKEMLMLAVTYPPGAVETVHRHDAHAVVYVTEGSIVMGVKGGKEQTLHAGQTFYEGPQDLHTVGRNASQTKPAKFVVVLVKDSAKPAVIPTDAAGHPAAH